MRLVRFQPGKGLPARLGLLKDDLVYDMEARGPRYLPPGDMKALLGLPQTTLEELASAALETLPVGAAEECLLCPLPNPGKFLAQAANYTHSGANAIPPTATPWLFSKRTDDLRGPGEPITLWRCAPDVVEEIEIAVVIGRSGRNIAVDRAHEHIAGLTICNDVSGRKLDLPPERRRREFDGFIDWLNGKWLDGFTILGPAIVTLDEFSDLQNLNIVTRVNGQVRVSGGTRDIIHSFAQTISFASRYMTLRTGDIIATGMPHGSGPETYLRPGDVVEGEITGLGRLRSPVVAEGV